MKERKILSSQLPTTNYQLPIIEWRRQRIPLAIFLVLCINLLVAPVVYAATDGTLERKSAYAIALLGLVTLGLVVYAYSCLESAQTSMTRHNFCSPNITIFFTILAVAVSFAWLGVEDPSRWQAGVALYILGRKSSNGAPRRVC